MSNEPKWEATIDEDNDGRIHYVVRKGEGCDGTFLAESKYYSEQLCDTLNRLESENAELRERLAEVEKLKTIFMNQALTLGDIVQELRQSSPRTDADGWISVQDRLPEHGKYVLAHYYETPLLKMINTWKYNKDNPHWTNGTFTHWMPLPEPPNQFRTSQAPTNPPEGIK